jgi:alkanesulfonate monooxygenase SsuD/methylene tetrahydromethanopterin reductase-like flavin-dependent oxidoreductase (luciferase family)
LTWLASHTRRLEFGPLVSPVSFRNPTMTARIASAVDDLSGGRLVLGVGAGWQAREHHNFGWDLLEVDDRFARFTEGLEIISLLLYSDQPVDYDGRFFHLHEAILLPRPQRHGGPPILVGGNGEKRTLPLAARLADEWNAVYITPTEFSRLNTRLDELLFVEGRESDEVRRSLMTGCVFGQDAAEVARKVSVRTQNKRDAAQLRAHGVLVGTGPELRDQLHELAEAGVEQVMLQWLDLDDLPGIEALAKQVLQ